MKIWKSIHIINSFWKQFIIYKLVRWNVECRYNGKGESIDEIENNLKFFYFYHNLRNHPKILSLNWHIKCNDSRWCVRKNKENLFKIEPSLTFLFKLRQPWMDQVKFHIDIINKISKTIIVTVNLPISRNKFTNTNVIYTPHNKI